MILCSNKPKKINEKVQYIINDYHIFNFLVQGEIVPVQLELSTDQLKFQFPDESLEMIITEKVTLSNYGNDNARYNIKIPENSAFEVNKLSGEIPAGSFHLINITYKPQNIKDEEKITVEIENGDNKEIHCEGISNETICEISQKHINLGTIGVC